MLKNRAKSQIPSGPVWCPEASLPDDQNSKNPVRVLSLYVRPNKTFDRVNRCYRESKPIIELLAKSDLDCGDEEGRVFRL